MNVSQAVKERHSTRAFKKDPIPDDVLHEILETARYAPSNCNTQPWHLTIVSGEPRNLLEKELVSEVMTGKPSESFFKPDAMDFSDIYRKRQVECAACLYGTMNIERHEKEKRNALMIQNWQFFGAPYVGFLSMPKTMGPVNALDIGIYLQTLMLLLTEQGIASCPQGALAFYPEPIYKTAAIPDGNAILCGLSFGYPNLDAQINQTRTPRDSLETTVNFIR